MTVAEASSSPAGYKTFTSTNATLATAISEVVNELAAHNINFGMTKIGYVFDDTAQEYTFMAICRT